MDMNTSLDSSSERFIPLRGSSFGSLKISHKYPSPVSISCLDYCRKYTENDSGVNYMQHFYKKNQYKDVLVNTLFQSPRRVLYFSPKQKARKENDQNTTNSDWPVRPRKKPVITIPEMVFDIPVETATTNMTGNRQFVDWGSSGQIAVIHDNSTIYTYNPDTHKRYSVLLHGSENCLKWNNEGDRLALSLKNCTLAIFDVNSLKMVRKTSFPMKSKISYIAYTRYFLITVHSNGMIQIWNHNLFQISTVCHAHKGVILSAKVSCYDRYLATNGVDSFIRIWSIPTCTTIYQIYCDQPIVSMDWHPWKESILAVGRSTRHSFCTLWNINQPSDIHTNSHPDKAEIDCLSFNPLSAELVVSFWLDRPSQNGEIAHNIVIQSNLNTVVDDINFHSARIFNFMWDKDGKRLATVSADENLAIWNFFGKDKTKRITPFKKDTSIFRCGVIR